MNQSLFRGLLLVSLLVTGASLVKATSIADRLSLPRPTCYPAWPRVRSAEKNALIQILPTDSIVQPCKFDYQNIERTSVFAELFEILSYPTSPSRPTLGLFGSNVSVGANDSRARREGSLTRRSLASMHPLTS